MPEPIHEIELDDEETVDDAIAVEDEDDDPESLAGEEIEEPPVSADRASNDE
jgi:hypothetical protein